MKLDLVALETLEAVVDCGSVALAADALNKAQSAVSYHLKKIEDQLGIALLDRSGYRLRLTAEGRVFLAEARPVLSRLRDLDQFSKRYTAGWEPELRIHFDGALPTRPLISAIKNLERLGCPTKIDLQVGFLEGVQASFAAQNGDILIAVAMKPPSHFSTVLLPDLELTLCCSANNPLARQMPISQSDLKDSTELVVSNDAGGTGLPTHYFGSRRVFRLCDFRTKLDAIRQGLGFGWLPQYLAQPALTRGELVVLQGRFRNVIRFEPVLAMQAQMPVGPAAEHITQQLMAADWNSEGSD